VNQAGNENELIDQILEGNKMLYNQLVVKYQGYAFTIANNILNSREDAEEVAHDAFVKAYRNLERFNRSAKFSTWLYRIVFNTAISYKRKNRITKESLDNAYYLSEPTPSGLEVADQKKFINKALKNLLAEDKLALTLFYLKEHSIEEIAEITEMKISTVKVRLYRARKRLADELKNILKEEALTL